MPARIKDIAGQRFSRLIALESTSKQSNDRCFIWKCLCDCGKIIFVPSSYLLCGITKSCGCLRKETAPKNAMSNLKNLTGQRFGRLITLETTTKGTSKGVVWKCLCDCGNIVFVRGRYLRQGNTKSCGCLHCASVFVRNTNIDPLSVPPEITRFMRARRKLKEAIKQAS